MANELFEISFIFFILLLHKKEIIMYNKQVRKYFICISIFSEIHHPETYRSGHNELDSKSSCRVTGTWVRIPPSPLPFVFHTKKSCQAGLFLFSKITVDSGQKSVCQNSHGGCRMIGSFVAQLNIYTGYGGVRSLRQIHGHGTAGKDFYAGRP